MERELRVATRRAGTYRVRFWFPLIVLAIVGVTWMRLTAPTISPQVVGTTLFYLTTAALTLFALAAGCQATADCLSVEKREGTLGLLFLTDLHGYDVVLGKFLANSVVLFYALLSVVPLLAISLLLGGVTGGEFVRLALVFLNALFFSLGAGMLASVWCHRADAARSAGLGLILLVGVLPPSLGWLQLWLTGFNGDYQPAFLLSCPVFTYWAGTAAAYGKSGGNLFYPSLAVIHACGWLFLLLAGGWLSRSWRMAAGGDVKFRFIFRRRNASAPGRKRRRPAPQAALDENAYGWLAMQSRVGATSLSLVYGLLGAVWIWGFHLMRRDWLNPFIFTLSFWALLAAFKATVANEVGRRLWEERRSGAIELLLSTPLSVAEIISGERLALQRKFRRSLPGLVIISSLLCGACWWYRESGSSGPAVMLGMQWAILMIFILDLIALFWLGLWKSVATPTTRRDFRRSASVVLALPWLLLLFLAPGFQPEFAGPVWPVVLWFTMSLFVDLSVISYARGNVQEKFRAAAVQCLEERRPAR
ncbi:MAG TPA: ABC transporter permease subunit [Verrucomicrobiota bacterium]|nr:ABC transporter permease subunit [Verrucomicrobiota bacterium]HNT15273.1 ABC transporter permease subunit [Verrucomicrobiota bacterium]